MNRSQINHRALLGGVLARPGRPCLRSSRALMSAEKTKGLLYYWRCLRKKQPGVLVSFVNRKDNTVWLWVNQIVEGRKEAERKTNAVSVGSCWSQAKRRLRNRGRTDGHIIGSVVAPGWDSGPGGSLRVPDRACSGDCACYVVCVTSGGGRRPTGLSCLSQQPTLPTVIAHSWHSLDPG